MVRAPKHMSLANESKPDRNSHYVDLLRSAKRLLLPHGYCDFVYSSTVLRGSPDKPDGETILNVLRCALHIFSGKNIYNFAFVALCGALQTHFHGWGRNGKRHLQRRFLRKRSAARKHCHSAHSSGATRHLPPTGGRLQRQRYSFRLKRKACGRACSPLGELSHSD